MDIQFFDDFHFAAFYFFCCAGWENDKITDRIQRCCEEQS